MKRTTLILDESILEGVRELARKENRTSSDVANALLAEGLQWRKAQGRSKFALASFSMEQKACMGLGTRYAL
jgi:predicted transcriptional regulator